MRKLILTINVFIVFIIGCGISNEKNKNDVINNKKTNLNDLNCCLEIISGHAYDYVEISLLGDELGWKYDSLKNQFSSKYFLSGKTINSRPIFEDSNKNFIYYNGNKNWIFARTFPIKNELINENIDFTLSCSECWDVSKARFEISETIDWDNYFLDGLPDLLQKSDKKNWEYDSSYYSYLELLDLDPYSNEAQILSISNHIYGYDSIISTLKDRKQNQINERKKLKSYGELNDLEVTLEIDFRDKTLNDENDYIIYNPNGIPYKINRIILLDEKGQKANGYSISGWKNGKIINQTIIDPTSFDNSDMNLYSVGFYDKDDIPDLVITNYSNTELTTYLSTSSKKNSLVGISDKQFIDNEEENDKDELIYYKNISFKNKNGYTYFITVPEFKWLDFTSKYTINIDSFSGLDYLSLAEKASVGDKFENCSPLLVLTLIIKGIEEINKHPNDWKYYASNIIGEYWYLYEGNYDKNWLNNYFSEIIKEFWGYWKDDILIPFSLNHCCEGFRNMDMYCCMNLKNRKDNALYNERLNKLKNKLSPRELTLAEKAFQYSDKHITYSVETQDYYEDDYVLGTEEIQGFHEPNHLYLKDEYLELINNVLSNNIDIELHINFKKSDSLLNSYYSQLKNKADSNGSINVFGDVYTPKISFTKLKNKQLNWIKHKEASANFFSLLNNKYSKDFWLNYFTIKRVEDFHLMLHNNKHNEELKGYYTLTKKDIAQIMAMRFNLP